MDVNVFPFTLSITVGCMAMKFHADIHINLRMNHFSDPLNVPLASSGQLTRVSVLDTVNRWKFGGQQSKVNVTLTYKTNL